MQVFFNVVSGQSSSFLFVLLNYYFLLLFLFVLLNFLFVLLNYSFITIFYLLIFFLNFLNYFFSAPLLSAQRLSGLIPLRKFVLLLIYYSNVWHVCLKLTSVETYQNLSW